MGRDREAVIRTGCLVRTRCRTWSGLSWSG